MTRGSLPFFSTLLSSGLALFLLGAYILLLLLGQLLLEQARAGLEYRVHLYTPVDSVQVHALYEWLRRHPLVREVRYIPPEEAMENFREIAGEEFVRAMEGFNPFPPTFRVLFHGEKVRSDSILRLTAHLLEWDMVKETEYPRRLLEILEKRTTTVQTIGLAVGVIMVVVTFLLIFNTVRLAIFARRLEIRTMELVGATRHYIQKPFLMVGVIQGLLSAFLACLSLHGALLLIDRYFLSLAFLLRDPRLAFVYAILLSFGGLVGYLASKFALERFLNQTLEKLI
ncbi:MAG: permease-like cell division protein FtsX [Bacteroidia bacterium]